MCLITGAASLGTKTSKWMMVQRKTLACVCSVYLCVPSFHMTTYVYWDVWNTRACVHVYMWYVHV